MILVDQEIHMDILLHQVIETDLIGREMRRLLSDLKSGLDEATW